MVVLVLPLLRLPAVLLGLLATSSGCPLRGTCRRSSMLLALLGGPVGAWGALVAASGWGRCLLGDGSTRSSTAGFRGRLGGC